jgi:acid phosphatase (class A)
MLKATISALSITGALCLLTACATTQSVKAPETAVAASEPMRNYLSASALPSSVLLVPPPPVAGSAALARDEEINRSALTMHGTPRWDMATNDSVLSFPTVAQTFSCALNLPISEEKTPKLFTLLRRTLVDAGRSTSEAKQRYQRTRPFVINGKPICTPNIEAGLRRDGSYPSGHAAIGWAFGLVLSEVSPEQTNALVARGRAFGQSRLVCNVHWQSDVLEGQMVASAVVARLNAEATFRNDVAAARNEVEALRATGAKLDKDCETEAQTLKSWN